MRTTFEHDMIPLYLPCGGVAEFDDGSGCSYRCEYCGATVGSIGQPRRCAEEAKKWDMLKKLGGKGWDYSTGRQEV